MKMYENKYTYENDIEVIYRHKEPTLPDRLIGDVKYVSIYNSDGKANRVECTLINIEQSIIEFKEEYIMIEFE